MYRRKRITGKNLISFLLSSRDCGFFLVYHLDMCDSQVVGMFDRDVKVAGSSPVQTII